MKAIITLRSGAKIAVDVEELSTERTPMTNELIRLKWTTPEVWSSKLHTVNVEQIDAIHLQKEGWKGS